MFIYIALASATRACFRLLMTTEQYVVQHKSINYFKTQRYKLLIIIYLLKYQLFHSSEIQKCSSFKVQITSNSIYLTASTGAKHQ